MINEFMSSNSSTLQDLDGDFSDWIELYNTSAFPINLENYGLSDELNDPYKWVFPSIVINPNEFLLVYASGKDQLAGELHTNFSLKSNGEILILSDPVFGNDDIFDPIHLISDKTYGRLDDGEDNFGILFTPTPGQSNTLTHFETEISFSQPPGFYPDDFMLQINCDDSVYYTTDGSVPTTSSHLYQSPIEITSDRPNSISLIPTNYMSYDPAVFPNNQFGFRTPPVDINKGTVVRAMAFKNGNASSRVHTKTYFTGDIGYTIPTFSIAMDSVDLFDFNTGIYVPGTHLDSTNMVWTGNYYNGGINWEKPGHVEFFDPNGQQQFSSEIGIRISGQKSRSAPQKSLRLYFREKYGLSKVHYPFFPKYYHSEFKRIMLRSSFTYWWGRNTLFQDDLIQTIAAQSEWNLDVQRTSPAVLFINGEYWGIQNIRERQDKHYLSTIHDINKDGVNIIEGNTAVIEGSAADFHALIFYVDANDLSLPQHYDFVKSRIDIDSYIDYYIIEMYFNNLDWPWNNVKLWKRQTPNAKWRWLLYDLDATMLSPDNNPFEQIESSASPNSQYYNVQSILFTKLLENTDFRSAFVKRFNYHLHYTFDPKKLEPFLDNFKTIYAPEVKEHVHRWGNPSSYGNWSESCDFISEFFRIRPCYMRDFLLEEFESEELEHFDCSYTNLDETVTVFPNPSAGNVSILLNEYIPTEAPFIYFDVYTQMGRLVCSHRNEGKLSQLDLTHLSNGIYHVKITYKGKNTTRKLVISKNF